MKIKIVIYGKLGCSLCDAAKEKMKILSLEYTFVDLDNPGENWRTNGAVDAAARYAFTEGLPIISINETLFDYPGAMKELKSRRSK